MSGGARWEPLEIDETEYKELVCELQRRGTKQGRFGWGSYEVPDAPSSVTTYDAWRAWRRAQRRPERARAVRAPTDPKLLLANVEAAEVSLRSVPPTNEELRVIRERALWESLLAVAEEMVSQWRERFSGRQALNEFQTLMHNAAELNRRLWQAERSRNNNEATGLREALAEAQDTVLEFLKRDPPQHRGKAD